MTTNGDEYVFETTATSSEPASIPITLGSSNQTVGTALDIRGASATSPIDASAGFQGGSATPQGSLTTTVGNDLVLGFQGDYMWNSGTTATVPSGWTQYQNAIAQYDWRQAAAAGTTQATAGTTGTVSFGLSQAGQWSLILIGVQPGVGTGIRLVASATSSTTGGSSNLTLTLAAPPAPGDLVVADLSGSLTGWTPLPTGWLLATSQQVNADVAIAYHVGVPGDPNGWTFSETGGTSANSGRIEDWTGFAATPQLDLTAAASTAGGATNLSVSPGTPGTMPELYVVAASLPTSNGPITFNQGVAADTGDPGALSSGEAILTATGSLNPTTATWATTTPVDMTVASFRAAPAAPSSPSGVTAYSQSGAEAVAWVPPSSNVPVTTYTVTPYVGSTAQGTTTVTGSPPPTAATVTGLTNGTSYTFTVTASNSIGSSVASAPSPMSIPRPSWNPLHEQYTGQVQHPSEPAAYSSLDTLVHSDSDIVDVNNEYVMFYRVRESTTPQLYSIAEAVSTDMKTWIQYGIVISYRTLDHVQVYPTCGSNYAPNVHVENLEEPNPGWLILTWENNYGIDGTLGGCGASTTPFGVGDHIDIAYSSDGGQTFNGISALLTPATNPTEPWEGGGQICKNPVDSSNVLCGDVGTPSLQWLSQGYYAITYHGYDGAPSGNSGDFQRAIAYQTASNPTNLNYNNWVGRSEIQIYGANGQLEGAQGSTYAGGIGRADIIQPQAGPGLNDGDYYMILEGFPKYIDCGPGYSQLLLAEASNIAGSYTISPVSPSFVDWPFVAGGHQAASNSGCYVDMPSWLYLGSDSVSQQNGYADTYWAITTTAFSPSQPTFYSLQPWTLQFMNS